MMPNYREDVSKFYEMFEPYSPGSVLRVTHDRGNGDLTFDYAFFGFDSENKPLLARHPVNPPLIFLDTSIEGMLIKKVERTDKIPLTQKELCTLLDIR